MLKMQLLLLLCVLLCVRTSSFLSPALQALSVKVTEKHGITSRLTELIMASEKKRDSKLNEIMKKMSTDGAGEGGGLARGASR